MGRRGGSGGRSARRAASSIPPAPQKVRDVPPPANVQNSGGSIFGSIGSAITEGMAFGTGSAVARRAVDAIMGPQTIRHENVVTEAAPLAPVATSMGVSEACNVQSKAFQDCLNSSGDDISKCQFYMDMLAECKRNSASVMSS
ncbi:Cox19-like CHCH family protein [Striga hermonthica]|uniref:Cox19-like CHCH family protein n=1 Tax=Striga hermonthica TaxID=68872 RepID=A0A9N7R251_STRHE|nr:Cox19-like CHCH family protein [Striga hermonthica]